MELRELIEKIVGPKGGLGAVETLMADIEDWPAWYYEMFDGERKYDFSGKKPTPIQKLHLSTVHGAVLGLVKEYAKEFKEKRGVVVPIDKVAWAIADRVVYWEDWYWDEAGQWEAQVEYEEREAASAAYSGQYLTEETMYGT